MLQKPGNRRQGFKEEPFYYLSDCIAEWESKFKSGKLTEPFVPEVSGPTTEPLETNTEVAECDAITDAASTVPSKSDETNDSPGIALAEADGSVHLTSTAISAANTNVNKSTEAPQSGAHDNDQEDLRIWSHISTFFGVNKTIPEASYKNFMTRSQEGRKRNLYFTNSFVRDLIDRNQDRMKVSLTSSI